MVALLLNLTWTRREQHMRVRWFYTKQDGRLLYNLVDAQSRKTSGLEPRIPVLF